MVECQTCGKQMERVSVAGHTAAMWCKGCGTLDDGLNKPVVPYVTRRMRELSSKNMSSSKVIRECGIQNHLFTTEEIGEIFPPGYGPVR